MNNKLKKIESLNLIWERDPRNSRFFFTKIEKDIYHLRMNDFPEEIMFTLFLNEQFVLDMEDTPNNWVVPFGEN